MWILLTMIGIMLFEENPYLYFARSFLGIPDITAIKLLGVLGLVWSALLLATGDSDLRWLQSRLTVAFFAFLGVTLLSGLASGAGLEPIMRLLAASLLMILVLSVVRGQRQLVSALRACALVAVLIFPYSFRQMLRFGERMGVGLYESNYFALILVLLLPLVVAFALTEASGWKKAFWMAGTGVVLLQIVLTGSRGGFVALLVVFPILAVRLLRRHLKLLAGMAVLLPILVFVVPNPLRDRLTASLSTDEERTMVSTSNEARMALLKAGTRMMLANPLTGVGLGKFKETVERYGDLPKAHIAHNTYLEIGAEQGMPTLLAFLFVMFTALRCLRRAERVARAARNRRLTALSVGMQAGIAGFLVGALFLSAQYENFFWLVIFLAIPLERIARRQLAKIRAEATVAPPPAAAAGLAIA